MTDVATADVGDVTRGENVKHAHRRQNVEKEDAMDSVEAGGSVKRGRPAGYRVGGGAKPGAAIPAQGDSTDVRAK